MELYDQSVKSGMDPELNSNLLDLQSGENQSQMSSVEPYHGPLNNLFANDIIQKLTSLKWQDR